MGPTGRSSTEVQEWAVDRPGDADGRVAVITGASSGVGLEVAGLLAARRALLINNAGLVLDLLAAVPGSRVVTVTSPAHRQGRIDFDDLQSTRRYRKSGRLCPVQAGQPALRLRAAATTGGGRGQDHFGGRPPRWGQERAQPAHAVGVPRSLLGVGPPDHPQR
jgi:hypothetical protein